MDFFINGVLIIAFQSNAISDSRVESGGDTIWDHPIGAIFGAILFGYLIYDYLKSKG